MLVNRCDENIQHSYANFPATSLRDAHKMPWIDLGLTLWTCTVLPIKTAKLREHTLVASGVAVFVEIGDAKG